MKAKVLAWSRHSWHTPAVCCRGSVDWPRFCLTTSLTVPRCPEDGHLWTKLPSTFRCNAGSPAYERSAVDNLRQHHHHRFIVINILFHPHQLAQSNLGCWLIQIPFKYHHSLWKSYIIWPRAIQSPEVAL